MRKNAEITLESLNAILSVIADLHELEKELEEVTGDEIIKSKVAKRLHKAIYEVTSTGDFFNCDVYNDREYSMVVDIEKVKYE